MTTPAVIMWCVVIAVGMFAAWRNPTALALVISWAFGEYIYLSTGDSLPVALYAYPDIAVIAIIAAKAERTLADRVVILIFPAMWVLYIVSDAALHPYFKWFALWFLAIAQLVAVGLESLLTFRRASNAASDTPDTPSSGDEFRRLAWGKAGSG